MVQKQSHRSKPRPRGRPRAYDPEIALQRATESFWRAGYAATSLDDLSAATGMNRPSLYGAFGDKREFYLAALRRYWGLSHVAMEEALAYDRTLREALRRLYRKALAGYFGGKDGPRGWFAIGTATTEAVRDPKIRSLLAEGFQMIDDAFAARIRVRQGSRRFAEGGRSGGAGDARFGHAAHARHPLARRRFAQHARGDGRCDGAPDLRATAPLSAVGQIDVVIFVRSTCCRRSRHVRFAPKATVGWGGRPLAAMMARRCDTARRGMTFAIASIVYARTIHFFVEQRR